jgi:predicted nucleic acid-binding protein
MAAFDCVLAETIGALARRVHEKRRVIDLASLLERLHIKFPKKSVTWLYPTLPDTYDEVVALVEQSGGELNFNDALIAISCRKREIGLLASFDPDFDHHAPWLKRIAHPDQLQDIASAP